MSRERQPTVHLPGDLHQRCKEAAARADLPVKRWVAVVLERALRQRSALEAHDPEPLLADLEEFKQQPFRLREASPRTVKKPVPVNGVTDGTVEAWASGMELSTEPIDENLPGAEWGIVATSEADGTTPILVVGLPGNRDHLVLAAKIVIGKDELRVLRDLDAEARSLFMCDLQLRLANSFLEVSFEAAYDGDENGEHLPPLDSLEVDFVSRLPGSEANEGCFYERFWTLQAAFTSTILMFNRLHLREAWP